jgi:hypothetical protein
MRPLSALLQRAQQAINKEESFVVSLAASYGRSVRTVKRDKWFLWVVAEVLTEQYDCWAHHSQTVVATRKSLGK